MAVVDNSSLTAKNVTILQNLAFSASLAMHGNKVAAYLVPYTASAATPMVKLKKPFVQTVNRNIQKLMIGATDCSLDSAISVVNIALIAKVKPSRTVHS